MPQKVKKALSCKMKVSRNQLTKVEEIEDEKENRRSKMECSRRKSNKGSTTVEFEEKKLELEKYLSPSLTPKVELKPLGFWSKKLQDLEEHKRKRKKCGLYDFSGTDESESSYKIKKKPRQKCISRKKKQGNIRKKLTMTVKKTKKIHKNALGQEQLILDQEKRKLIDKGHKFKFSTQTDYQGITSTPAANRDNLIDASNFLFLSPIIGEVQNNNSIREFSFDNPKTFHAGSPAVHFDQETPKVETKLKRISCRRVLRSGKTLNT